MEINDRLFTRDFSLVVVGQIVSILGSAILRFALNLYVLNLTGRADIFAPVIALPTISEMPDPLGRLDTERKCL